MKRQPALQFWVVLTSFTSVFRRDFTEGTKQCLHVVQVLKTSFAVRCCHKLRCSEALQLASMRGAGNTETHACIYPSDN